MELSHVSHQLLLIRHAQSQNNANEEQARICDPGITDLGRQQAESLSRFLSSMDFESIICSAFRRALQTAEHLNSTLGKPSEVLIDLHEHGGCYEGWHSENFVGMPGMTDTEIEAEFSNVVFPDDYPADGWWLPYVGYCCSIGVKCAGSAWVLFTVLLMPRGGAAGCWISFIPA